MYSFLRIVSRIIIKLWGFLSSGFFNFFYYFFLITLKLRLKYLFLNRISKTVILTILLTGWCVPSLQEVWKLMAQNYCPDLWKGVEAVFYVTFFLPQLPCPMLNVRFLLSNASFCCFSFVHCSLRKMVQ